MDATRMASGFQTTMEHKGFQFRLQKTKRLTGDKCHGLPSGVPIPVWPTLSLPGCPDDWVKEAGSFVCPVSEEWGLWFDWRNIDNVSKDLNTAVVPSVKGMNPLTMQKLENLKMEQYLEECPIHKKKFSNDRFCEDCGYKWVTQNYISHPNKLWLDGFIRPDGTSQQFFFTQDDQRDIASLVMGKENTVPAFGFAFYETKRPRVIVQSEPHRAMNFLRMGRYSGNTGVTGPTGTSGIAGSNRRSTTNRGADYVRSEREIRSTGALSADSVIYSSSSNQNNDAEDFGQIMNQTEQFVEASVGAGAQIQQKIQKDPLGLEEWKSEPSALIRLYFVFENQFSDILKRGGVKDLVDGNPEGALSGLPIG